MIQVDNALCRDGWYMLMITITVVAILVDNAEPVEFDQPLFVIN